MTPGIGAVCVPLPPAGLRTGRGGGGGAGAGCRSRAGGRRFARRRCSCRGVGRETRSDGGAGQVFLVGQVDLIRFAADDDFKVVGVDFLHVDDELAVADIQGIASHRYLPLGCQLLFCRARPVASQRLAKIWLPGQY
jgi:hypothetical protein